MAHLRTAATQIETYQRRFTNRLKPVHAVHLKQCSAVIEALVSICEQWSTTKAESTGRTHKAQEQLFRINEITSQMKGGADQVNLIELVQYLKDSHIAQKVSGYAEKAAQSGNSDGRIRSCRLTRLKLMRRHCLGITRKALAHQNISAFRQVENFLLSLTEANEDGRILISTEFGPPEGNATPKAKISMRYILLNPAEHFSSVVKEARSVVLAGGTMTPVGRG